jgi:large subunit ribosomal protein L29
MKVAKMREMSVEELENEASTLSEQLFKLRFQKATGQLDNVTKFRQVRKDLARVRTIFTERAKSNDSS